MRSGFISLEKLYEYAKNDSKGEALLGKSLKGRKYGKLVKDIVETIENNSGFYLWGKYEKNKLWRNIYLGKAGYGKTTSLRARILEELKDEKSFLWVNTIIPEKELLKIAANYYPNMWYKYKSHYKRANLKDGATHILWVSNTNLSNNDVIKIEADLIETLNPIANFIRPTPISDLQDETISIIKEFKSIIHKNRLNI